MLKKIKRIILLLLILNIGSLIRVEAIVKPTDEFYVNDYANILNEETEKYILEHSVTLAEKTKAQIVVVTVPNLENNNIDFYANELFRSFGIGDQEENNGLLILISLDDREYRVEVGYGLEGILPDGKVGRYVDKYMISYLSNNQFDEAIKNGYNAFYNEICDYYGLPNETLVLNTNDSFSQVFIYLTFFYFIICGIVFGFISYDYRISKKKNKKIEHYGLIGKTILLILGVINFGLLFFIRNLAIVYVPVEIILFICLCFDKFDKKSKGNSGSSRGYYHSSSSSSSFHSSSSSHSGGGGSSGGGGRSGRF